MFQRFLQVTMFSWLTLPVATTAWAQEDTSFAWPQEIETAEGLVIVYQPQPEELQDNQLKARAAVAVERKGSDAPVFGAVWFDARLETDRSERTATIADVDVINVRFPGQDKDKQKKLENLLEQEVPKWDLEISMDQLLTTLDLQEKRVAISQNINTDPPEIIFMAEPAVLITIDGEPQLRAVEGSEVQRVINTPFTLLYDPASQIYYLNADANTWYTAKI